MWAPVLRDQQAISGSEAVAHSFMNTSALLGSVMMVPSICLRPASPPSNRPSSTSVATPAAMHRLIQGMAMAMFSSSDYILSSVSPAAKRVSSHQRARHLP